MNSRPASTSRDAPPRRAKLTTTLVGLCGLAIGLCACSQKQPEVPPRLVKTSYYFWKSKVNIPEAWVRKYKPHRLYIKFLDLGYRRKLEVVVTDVSAPVSAPVVPVVFLDHRLLHRYDAAALRGHIVRNIPPKNYRALQMDCDWTLGTRAAYFELLKGLAPTYPKLSATIRLHQIKYFKKTGVPPVQRGTLMYYNMSNIRDVGIKNYILDVDVGRRYHVNFDKYPLPLDLALPIYSQARVVRQGKVVMLLKLEALNPKSLRDTSDGAGHTYRVLKGHYAGGRYLYEDDELKIDSVTVDGLKDAARALKPLMKPNEVIFYEQSYAKHFGPAALSSVVRLLD